MRHFYHIFRWEVHTEDKRSKATKIHNFDKVIFATGPFRSAFLPNIPGMEHFKGQMLHAKEFRRRDILKGKRVILVGEQLFTIGYDQPSGGSTCKSSRRAPPPPTGPNSFVFTYVFTEKHLYRRLAPPPTRVGAPPTGNPGSAPAEPVGRRTSTAKLRGEYLSYPFNYVPSVIYPDN